MAERAKILTAFIDVIFNGDQAEPGARELSRNIKREFESLKTDVSAAVRQTVDNITASFKAGIQRYVETGAALADMSDRTGIAVETLGELKFAAEQSGGSIEGLEAAIRTMQRGLDDAGQASLASAEKQAEASVKTGETIKKAEERYADLVTEQRKAVAAAVDEGLARAEVADVSERYAQRIVKAQEAVSAAQRKSNAAIEKAGEVTSPAAVALGRLGIQYKDIAALRPDEQFMRIATALATVSDPTMRAALAMDIFGKTGVNLLPMLANGAEGIAAMRKEAHAMGQVMSGEQAETARRFGDNIEKLKGGLMGLFNLLAEVLIPEMNKVVETITPWVKWLIELAREHKSVTASIAHTVAAMLLISTVLGRLEFFLRAARLAWRVLAAEKVAAAAATRAAAAAAAAATPAVASVGAAATATAAATTAAGTAAAGTAGAMGALQVSATGAAAGTTAAGAAAGAAALAWLPFIAAIAAVTGAIYLLYRASELLIEDAKKVAESNRQLEESTHRYAAAVERKGAVLDEAAMKEMDASQRIVYASQQMAAAKEAATVRELTALTGAEATKEQIHRAELARLALGVNAKEAAVVALTSLDTEQIKGLMALDGAQKESFRAWMAGSRELVRTNEEHTALVRKQLMRLSLDHRESPSVNDLAAQGFARYLGMLSQFAQQQGGILEGIRALWMSTWSNIVAYVQQAISYLMNAGAQAMGMGGGGAGLVPQYAGGTRSHRGGYMDVGHGMELVSRPTRMWAPQGTRVFNAGETAEILKAAGATNISVSVNVDGGAFINDRATVEAWTRAMGDGLARSLKEELRARGK